MHDIPPNPKLLFRGIHQLKVIKPDPDNYIFVRIPRTGSTSMCHALRKPTNHKPIDKIREEDPDFDKKFKFSVVRNPYDRFLSAFYFSGEFLKLNIPPNEFVEKYNFAELTEKESHAKIFLRPQTEYVYHADGELGVDYLGRFENLKETWETIKEKLGVKNDLPRMRSCRYEKVPLTRKSKDKLYEFYKNDFVNFDYKK